MSNSIFSPGQKIGIKIKGENNFDEYIIEDYIASGASCNVYSGRKISQNENNKINPLRIIREYIPRRYFVDPNVKGVERYYIGDNDDICIGFSVKLPAIRDSIMEDVKAFYKYFSDFNHVFSDETQSELFKYIIDSHDWNPIEKNKQNDNEKSIVYSWFVTEYKALKSVDTFLKENIDNDRKSFVRKLKMLKTLSVSMDEFEKRGYLWLDIKPSNVLYTDDNVTMLQLFDYDAIVKKEDLIGKNLALRFSSEYAAPEVIKNNKEKISASSVAYTLGVILFEIVFGEKWNRYVAKFYANKTIIFKLPITVTFNDSIDFNKPDFEIFFNKLAFEEPVKDKIFSIWIKAFNLRSRFRYSSCAEFAHDISDLIEIVEHKGIHPESMLKAAMQLRAKWQNEQKDIDENLLGDVTFVNNFEKDS